MSIAYNIKLFDHNEHVKAAKAFAKTQSCHAHVEAYIWYCTSISSITCLV